MSRKTQISTVLCLLFSCSLSFAQQHRIFFQKAGDNPNGVPPGGPVISANGGDIISLDCYIENGPPGERIRLVQVAAPCLAMGGTSGSVTLQYPVLYNTGRPDYLYYGPKYCRAGDNIGLICTSDSGCPNATAGDDCGTASSINNDPGNECSDSIYQRSESLALGAQPAVVLIQPRYMMTFQYQISDDAEGTFVIDVPNEPDSASRNQAAQPIPFVTSGATINIAVGQCCNGTTCLGDQTKHACLSSGNFWNPNRTCADSCACATSLQCNDHDTCSFESCSSGNCQGIPVSYGNVNGDGVALPNLDDILCAVSGFANAGNCPNADIHPPCTGDGLVNLDDLLKVLSAFAGADPCGCND